jgi:8-oxo-dGTP diphosphatase
VTEKQLVVGAVVVDDLDDPALVLAAQRNAPAALRGRWEFPGGKVEPGEGPRTALVRELAEELQVEVRLGPELGGPDDGHWPISDAFRMRVWFAMITEGTATSTGSHQEVRWLKPSELQALPWVVADEPIVAALLRRLGLAG